MQERPTRRFEIKEKLSTATFFGQRTRWKEVLSNGGGGNKKRFQYCLKPDHPDRLLYLRAIQGHSRKAFSGNARKTMYCYQRILPSTFITSETERNWVTVWCQEDSALKQAGRPYSLPLWRIAPYKNTWKPLQDTVYWCNLLLAQERGLQFYQTRSNAVVLYDTLPVRMCWESEMHKTTCCSQSIFAMRVTRSSLTRAKSSWKTQSNVQSFHETRCNIVDYRIPGISIPTVQEQDEQKKSCSIDRDVWITTAQGPFFLRKKTGVRRRRSTSSAKHRKNCLKTWTTQRFSNFVRIPRSFNAQTATPSETAASFIAVAGEIWSMEEVSHNFEKTTSSSIRSMATSLGKFQSKTKAWSIWTTKMKFHKGNEMLRKTEKHGYPTILSR